MNERSLNARALGQTRDAPALDLGATHLAAPRTRTYQHSGALGDVIYALAAIRADGGGDLWLDDHMANVPRQFASLAPLARRQTYITAVHGGTREAPYANLNGFRPLMTERAPAIAHAHFCALAQPFDASPWLDWPAVDPDQREPFVIVNRTPRYNLPGIRWDEHLAREPLPKLFLGLRAEHAAFEHSFGPIEFIDCGLADAAEWLARSSKFYGNASALLAIAQGLGIPRAVEFSHDSHWMSHFASPLEELLA